MNFLFFKDIFGRKKIKELKEEIDKLERLLSPEIGEYRAIEREISMLNETLNSLKDDEVKAERTKNKLLREIEKLNEDIKRLKSEIVELDETILFQEYGLYHPIYGFSNSLEYKTKLELNRKKQKELIKNKMAVNYVDTWTVDGSRAKGRKMNNDNIKQIIRTFNIECEVIIDKVKFSNVESMEQRIIKSFNSLNKMNESNIISLKRSFLNLKLEELRLAHEFQIKKQEEKEEQKRQREELKEQARLEKELSEQRKNAEKDLKHYKKAIDTLNKKLETTSSDEEKNDIIEKINEIKGHKNTVEENLKTIDYRQANQKAGYVYIISNIGAFGENVYKIGMTRRLEPKERIDELSGASVPFKFDIHAMIFSDDAPKLENKLHKAFSDRKVNMVNQRKEFFNVTLKEIEEVVSQNYDKTVEFNYVPTAEQYRETIRIKNEIQNKK